jgi:hypothetical protein
MDCKKLFCRCASAVLTFLCLCLLCSCRKLSPDRNAFSAWQYEWQGIPLSAVSHSEEHNLFLPPAPVFFASTKNDSQSTSQIQWNDLGPADAALKEYCQTWNEILARKLPPEINLPIAFSLPPPPWMTVLTEEDFRKTVKFLYSALGEAELSATQKENLEVLVVFHEQQQQLAEVLSFICQINRGKNCHLDEGLRKFRIFREFQQNFAGHLTARLMPELQLPSQMVDEQLRLFLALPQLEVPLLCLPSLWMGVRELPDKPISAAGKTLADWRDLAPSPLRYAAIWEDYQTARQQCEEGFTWLIMSFASPQPEKDRSFYLAFPPLPEQSEIFLNGIAQSFTPKQAAAFAVRGAESLEDEQLLAVRFPNSSLGSPLWPPWLVKQTKP